MNNEEIFAQALATQNNPEFPQINLSMVEKLRAVQMSLAKDPQYLRRRDCPYDPRTRGFLEEIFKAYDADETQIAADVAAYFEGNNDDTQNTYDILVRDAKKAYLTLSRLGQKMEQSNKPEDELNKVKTMTQLQERLMTVIEKAEGYKQIHQFKRTIMDIIEQVLTPEQRTGVMEKIEESLKN